MPRHAQAERAGMQRTLVYVCETKSGIAQRRYSGPIAFANAMDCFAVK